MGSDGKRAASSAAEIVFRGVTKRYPGRRAAAVDNLSLRIPAGEICVLVGLSGGQQQRVGLARAMAADPAVMLMDEPFGALDPITRDRLQQEFLRLHVEIRKTVIFVTHDIDEAIKMGDRIAILREGGILAQYDTPDAILANPADEFVARFVGADRSLKRLALKRLADIELPVTPNGDGSPYPPVAASATLRDALALMLEEGRRELAVVEDGNVCGLCSVDQVADLLAPERRQ